MMALGYTHAILMIVAFLGLFLGFTVARFMKKKSWWLKVHRSLGITSAILVLIGLFAVALQITLTGRAHFRIPHAYLGTFVVLLALLTPTLGLMMIRMRNKAGKLRTYHRWSGRTTLALMFVNVVAGLKLIGVI